jgi:hypothetical protein
MNLPTPIVESEVHNLLPTQAQNKKYGLHKEGKTPNTHYLFNQ